LEAEKRRMEMERVSHYRAELQRQMDEKNQRSVHNRNEQMRNQEEYRKYARLPEEIKQIERERKLEEMNKYRQDLDRVRQEK
jgi:hypothetical protein